MNYTQRKAALRAEPGTWPAIGFIGFNLLEILLPLDLNVVGTDNFSIGFR